MIGPTFTVILATRNRTAVLATALEGLLRQDTGGQFTYDIVVADNGSTDETAALVRQAQVRSAVPIGYLFEPRPGKPFALNTAIAQARGEILAFTDDDIIAGTQWLAGLRRAFAETSADAVAGRVLPQWEGITPGHDTEQIIAHVGTIGCLDFGEERLQMSPGADRYWWVGSNIAVRREVLQRCGAFDVRLIRGQDVELFARLRRRGAAIVYEPSALLHHRIGKDRVTPDAFRRWYRERGYYRAFTQPWQPSHALTVMPLSWYKDVVQLAWRWARTAGDPARRWERLSYDCRLRAHFSHLRHRLQLLPSWWRALAAAAPREGFPQPMQVRG